MFWLLTKDWNRPLGSPSFPRCGRFGSVDFFTAAASSYEDSPRRKISLRHKFERVVDAPNTDQLLGDTCLEYTKKPFKRSFIFNSKLFWKLGSISGRLMRDVRCLMLKESFQCIGIQFLEFGRRKTSRTHFLWMSIEYLTNFNQFCINIQTGEVKGIYYLVPIF